MADQDHAPDTGSESTAAVETATDSTMTLDKAKKVEDLVDLPHTPEHSRRVAELSADKDIKIPKELDKVSDAKARELVEAGIVEDADLPGKMYKRKADGFVTRIPNYTFNAYPDYHQDEWEEIKLTSDPDAQKK